MSDMKNMIILRVSLLTGENKTTSSILSLNPLLSMRPHIPLTTQLSPILRKPKEKFKRKKRSIQKKLRSDSRKKRERGPIFKGRLILKIRLSMIMRLHLMQINILKKWNGLLLINLNKRLSMQLKMLPGKLNKLMRSQNIKCNWKLKSLPLKLLTKRETLSSKQQKLLLQLPNWRNKRWKLP
jgi:hypothetical protein